MQSLAAIEKVWREKSRTGPFHRKVTVTDTGLMLGREIILASPAGGAPAEAGFSVYNGDESRVLALLTAAYGCPVGDHIFTKMRRASELWHRGEKALAQIHLAFADLPDADEAVAYRLFLAVKILDSGHSPESLMKALAFEPTAPDAKKYNRDQPRVPGGNGRESGQWTSRDSGPGSGSQDRLPPSRHVEIVHVNVVGARRSDVEDAEAPSLVPGAQYAQASLTPTITPNTINDILEKHGPSAPPEKGKFTAEYATDDAIRSLIKQAWEKATPADVAAGRWGGGVVIAGSVFEIDLDTGAKVPYIIGTSGIRSTVRSIPTNTYVVVLESNMNVKTCYPINPADAVNPRDE
jgi:hypothetical protein